MFASGYFYLWQVHLLNRLLAKLIDSSVVIYKPQGNRDLRTKFLKGFSLDSGLGRGWQLASILLAMGAAATLAFIVFTSETDYVFARVAIPMLIVSYHIAFMILSRTIKSIWEFRLVFRDSDVNLQPLNPDSAAGFGEIRPFFRLGTISADLGQHEISVQYYRHAIALDPDNAVGLHNLGLGLFHLARYAESIEMLTRAVALKPTVETLLNLAMAYEFDGQVARAQSAYAQARRLDSTH